MQYLALDFERFWSFISHESHGQTGQCVAFSAVLPTPPTDNQCHRSGQYTTRSGGTGRTRYATDEYKDWLNTCSLILQWAKIVPDMSSSWAVEILVYRGKRRFDPQNIVKPVLDLLSGSRVETVSRQGKRSYERITKGGFVWDDDRRVVSVTLRVEVAGIPQDLLQVKARVAPPPPVFQGKDEWELFSKEGSEGRISLKRKGWK